MSKFVGYICSLCGTEYSSTEVTYTCPKDGGNLDVVLDYAFIKAKYQPEDILSRNDPSLWRYLPLLPVSEPEGEATPLHAAGGTPVFKLTRLAQKLGLENLWLKDESRNPTASFKDRASAIVVARAQEIKAEIVVTASTGNAGAALAGMSAAVGQKAIIFAPKSAPQAKVAQLLIFGAKVILVDGTYDDAFDLTIKCSNEFGWYCRNTGYNPFTAEGKKTAAFEIWEWWEETYRKWHAEIGEETDHSPLTVFVSVGDGNIISGIHKGFKDLVQLGWLPRMPRIIGVQADGSAAISNAFHGNTETITPVSATTIADSISVDLPRDGVRAVRAAKETGGTYVNVSDEEIIQSIAELGRVGVFAEPAGATAYAGLVKATATGVVGSEDPILVLNTGSGLKDIRAAMQAVVSAPIIEPTLEAVKKAVMKKDTQWTLLFRYVMGILFFAAFIVFLFYAHDAVRNLVIAAFVAYLINPAVVFLARRTRMSRRSAVNIVYFSSLILLVGVPATLTPIFYDEVQIVFQDILDLSNQISSVLSQPVHIGNLVFHLEAWGQNLSQIQGAFLTPLPEEALQLLETTSLGALWFLVILVSVYLFLSEWPSMRNSLLQFVLSPYRTELEELYKRIRRVWMAYLRGQIVLMIIVGVVFTIAWTAMGIPGALVLGVLAGFFTLVPDVGPFLAAALATGVALLEGSTWIPLSNFWVAAIVVAVYLVLIGLKNFFLRPLIMGRSVHMNEGLVFIVIMIATILEGILGALLVVPVIASVVVIAGYVQRKVLGLPAFEDDGSMQFVAPPEKLKPVPRGGRKVMDNDPLDDEPASFSPQPGSGSTAESQPRRTPARKKTDK